MLLAAGIKTYWFVLGIGVMALAVPFLWNNFLDPYLFINSIDKQMITPALKFFQERGGANIPVQLAGASLAIIPILILFTVTQKYFVAGVSSSGIKG